MRLTNIIASAALGACLLSSPAFADPSPDAAERLQLARQVMDAGGSVKAADQRVEAMLDNSSKLVALNTPPDGMRFAMAIQRDMRDEMLKMVPSLVDLTVQAYAENLTAQELRDYLAWITSNSGKAIVAKMPAIQRQVMDHATPMMAQMLPELSHKVSDRVCEELHCTADERKIVAQVMAKTLPQPKS